MELENLSKSQRKKLKKQERQMEKADAREKRAKVKKRKKIIMYSIIGLIVLLIVYFNNPFEKQNTNLISGGMPIMVIEPSLLNLGTVSQKNGITEAEFKITNQGDGSLVIDNMDTSCMCTNVKLVINGQTSPKFGMAMHGNPKGYLGVINPGETATLKVFYDPNAHKELTGPVTRIINIYSNDPSQSKKEVKIKLNQVR